MRKSARVTIKKWTTYRRIDALLAILDEYRDFPCTRRLQNLRKLGDSLLQNLRRTDIDFGDYDHDGDI